MKTELIKIFDKHNLGMTDHDVDKAIAEILALFSVSQQRELLKAFYKSLKDGDYLYTDECDMHIDNFLNNL